jgi:hypothetical protein
MSNIGAFETRAADGRGLSNDHNFIRLMAGAEAVANQVNAREFAVIAVAIGDKGGVGVALTGESFGDGFISAAASRIDPTSEWLDGMVEFLKKEVLGPVEQ